MQAIKEQRAENIADLEKEAFKATLANRPIRLSGMWPPSDTAEGIRARTDIAIELVRKGYLNYDTGSQFTVADYPIQLGHGRTYKPGVPFPLTWLNDAQLEEALG